MADISTFPQVRNVLKSGSNVQTFIAGATIKAAQIVAFHGTGVSNTLHPAVRGVTAMIAGVALYDAAVGTLIAVACRGCKAKVVNADASTAIDAGSQIGDDYNAIGGTVSITEGTVYSAGQTKQDIPGGGMGIIDVAPSSTLGATGRGDTLLVAANDSPALSKQQADYVCTGSADQVVLQSAIDDAQAGSLDLHLTAGTYDMDYTDGYGSINLLRDGMTLSGAGAQTIFKRNSELAANRPVIVVGTDWGHVNDLTLSNFKIDGNNLQGMGIRSRGSDLSNISIHDIAIADTATAGKVSDEAIRIYANAEKTCENISVRNCRLDNTGGLCIFECENVFITDNRVLNSVWDAPSSQNNGAIRCTGNDLLKVVDNIIDGVSCNSNPHLANGISFGNSTNFKVDSNILSNVAGHGINVQTAAHYGTINNNTLSNIDYEHICIEYGNSSYINVVGNTGYNSGMYGIWVSGEVDVPADASEVASYIKISDNILHDCGNNSAGIRAYHADKIQILNNTIHDCGNEGISLHSVHGCLVQANTIAKTCQTSHDASILLSVHVDGGCYLCIDNVVKNNYIIENDTIKPTHAIEEVAGGNVYDNIFRNNITDGFVSAQKTENSGTATILSAGTSVVVTHGLRSTPAAGDIMVVPLETWGNMTKFWIDSYTATQFTIHADQAPGANKLFAWKAIVL